MPWKIITFAIATATLTYIGTIANDPTWDIYVSLSMSVLTYLTSSFFIISFYECIIANKFQKHIVALLLSIFFFYISVSASYDFYNLFIIKAWPDSHVENIFVSSMFYLAGGLFWGADFEELSNSYLFKKRKLFYISTSIFIAFSFLYFGVFN